MHSDDVNVLLDDIERCTDDELDGQCLTDDIFDEIRAEFEDELNNETRFDNFEL